MVVDRATAMGRGRLSADRWGRPSWGDCLGLGKTFSRSSKSFEGVSNRLVRRIRG